jgi:signal-transduction protein with cAMP-binding, CBS, and nucleotidyltransferase domain
MPSANGVRIDKSFGEVLKKIPLFKGLSPSGIQKILGICSPQAYEPETQICKADSPSNRLYIILSGELAVITNDGLRVATISPITTIGEMGFITRHPCSATVEVTRPSNILA